MSNYLNMSDADISASTGPVAEAPAESPTILDTPSTEVMDILTGDETDQVTEGEGTTTETNDGGGEDASEGGDATEGAGTAPEGASTKEEASTTDPVDKEIAKADDEVVVDFAAEYNRLMAPFKANGREVQVKTVDEAITLMQMGANYSKKMAGLKPNLKLMKMLDSSGNLSEEKISYMIDLVSKDPGAINRLIKESGLNPMDLDAEKASEYKPKIHSVDDREIELDTVLDSIADTPTYNRTIDLVGKQWDGESKKTVANNPQLLAVINDHMQRGIYDVIAAEVERERLFGRFDGVTDIEAYRTVGDAIQARGGFDNLGKAPATKAAAPVVVTPKPKVPVDAALNEKRRAAGSTKPASIVPKTAFNPLEMSDEEIEKINWRA